MITIMRVDKLSEEVNDSIDVFQKYTVNARCIKIRDILAFRELTRSLIIYYKKSLGYLLRF
jgi:hypothetical protein